MLDMASLMKIKRSTMAEIAIRVATTVKTLVVVEHIEEGTTTTISIRTNIILKGTLDMVDNHTIWDTMNTLTNVVGMVNNLWIRTCRVLEDTIRTTNTRKETRIRATVAIILETIKMFTNISKEETSSVVFKELEQLIATRLFRDGAVEDSKIQIA